MNLHAVGTARIYLGDCRDVVTALDPVDAVVTDPPYGLGFMGKGWDHGVPGAEFWSSIAACVKPGANLLAFGGTRSFHRLACAIEDAGWQLRDTIMWVYGSGFPKSRNLGDGWGTALKPAWEPIIVARAPLAGTTGATHGEHGTGALNVDGCRISSHGDKLGGGDESASSAAKRNSHEGWRRPCHDDPNWCAAKAERARESVRRAEALGRWPANLIHDGSDEVLALFPREAGAAAPVHRRNSDKTRNTFGAFGDRDEDGATFHGDTGSAARFFYCAKATRADRNEGLEGRDRKPLNWSAGEQSPGTFQSEGTERAVENYHPTVKPTPLMRYLCRLVTPPGGTVLDPFMGSGSTGKAAAAEGFRFVGIEEQPEYFDIAAARLKVAHAQPGLFS